MRWTFTRPLRRSSATFQKISPYFACADPHAATRAARWFLEHFPGETLYAVKANDSPVIVGALLDAGIRHFDVASSTELRTAGALPGAVMHVMHPVKPRRLIAEAYHDFGVRTFALELRNRA